MLDERETQAPPAAAPEGSGEGDFHPEQFMAPEPAPSRWAQPLLIGVGAVAVLAALGLGTLWMQDEHKANASLDVLASSARQAPAAAAAPPPALPRVAPTPVPPLVMLEPDKPVKAAPPVVAKSVAPPVAVKPPVAAVVKPAAPSTSKLAMKAKPKAARPVLAARTPRGITLPPPRPKGITLPPPSPRGITLPPPSSGKTLLAEQMKRCKTGDLARECLDDLCRHGGRGDPACRARLLVD